MTLGETIGIVTHSFDNTNDAGEKVKALRIKIDFTGASDIDIKSWLCSNRVIAFARPLSKLPLEEMEALEGETFQATSIGQKIMSKQERMLAQLFNKVKDNPEKLAQLNELLEEDN